MVSVDQIRSITSLVLVALSTLIVNCEEKQFVQTNNIRLPTGFKRKSRDDSTQDRFSFSSFFLPQQDRHSKRQQQHVVDSSTPLRCGRRIQTYETRIVGGKKASVADFPWMVSLQREKGHWLGMKAYHHSCGGSLLSESWIITAAHCLYNRDEPLRIVAGTDNLQFMHRAQIRTVSKTIIHPWFDSTSYDNDLALIKVSRPLNLRSTLSHVSAICFERDIPLETYDIVTICGFGAKAFHEKARNHLYTTDIAIIDQNTCNQSFDNMITNNMICAGGMIANKRDACSGDSGGPLQIEVGDHISIVGLVSFGNDCAIKNFPGVYTKLKNYYDWIVENIDESLIAS